MTNRPSSCNAPESVSKLNDHNLAGRNKRFKTMEEDLETLCSSNNVDYEPPAIKESGNKTKIRRRKLNELCDPNRKSKGSQ